MLHPRITEFVTITVSRGFIIYLSRIVLFCAHFLATLARLSSRTISVAEFLFRDLVAGISPLRTTLVFEFSPPGTTLVAEFSISFLDVWLKNEVIKSVFSPTSRLFFASVNAVAISIDFLTGVEGFFLSPPP